MNIAHRLGLRGTLITLGVVLALAAVVTISNTPAHASSTPDLEVTRLSPMYDFPLFTGESFYLNATVENKGDGESATTTLRFYQSSDSTITTSDTELGTIALGTLAAGVSRIRQSPELTAPSTAGVYYYGACVDSVSGESDTSNNCPDFSTFLRVEDPGPNLGTTRINVEYDSPLITEESLYLKATIENSGDEESPTTTVRYYQSSDNTITAADTELGTAAIDALESGTSTIVKSPELTAPSTAGTYYFGACVDSVSGESDTSDNCKAYHLSLRVQKPGPNLTLLLVLAIYESLTVPAPGGSFSLETLVINHGTQESAATTLRWYRSTNTQMDTSSDTEVGTNAISALSAGGSSEPSIDLTAPSTSGIHYYYACVDAVTDESVTTDNCSMGTEIVPVNSPATNVPTISGTPQVGKTLTASTTEIADADGLTNVSYSYQWLADDSEISGATSSTYTVQASDNGKVIKVRVTFTDDAGNYERLTSEGTAAVVMGGL